MTPHTATEPDDFPETSPTPEADERVAALLRLLGRAHTLAILYAFARDSGPWRFGELERGLDVPPNTLTERLRELVDAGLLERRSFDEIPPRVEYTATEAAEALKPAFGHLYDWTRAHDLRSDGR